MTETVIFEDKATGVVITLINGERFSISRPALSGGALTRNHIDMSGAEFTALGAWFMKQLDYGKQK